MEYHYIAYILATQLTSGAHHRRRRRAYWNYTNIAPYSFSSGDRKTESSSQDSLPPIFISKETPSNSGTAQDHWKVGQWNDMGQWNTKELYGQLWDKLKS